MRHAKYMAVEEHEAIARQIVAALAALEAVAGDILAAYAVNSVAGRLAAKFLPGNGGNPVSELKAAMEVLFYRECHHRNARNPYAPKG